MKSLLLIVLLAIAPLVAGSNPTLIDDSTQTAVLKDFYVDNTAITDIIALDHVQYIRVWFLEWSSFNDEVRVFIDYGQYVTRPNRSNVMTAGGDRINFNSKAHVINSLAYYGFELLQADATEYYFRKR